MNISNKVQWVWWASARCGSRAVSEVLKHYDFFNYQLAPILQESSDIRYVSHSHLCNVPSEYSHYPILMQIRNPYSRMVSYWHLYCFKEINNELVVTKNFEEYVFGFENHPDHYEQSAKKYKPACYIRYEHLNEDIKKIPFIDMNTVQYDFAENVLQNKYKYEGVDDPRGDIRRNITDNRYADWQSYYVYNNKVADMVYDLYKKAFQEFGYEKDSWKK